MSSQENYFCLFLMELERFHPSSDVYDLFCTQAELVGLVISFEEDMKLSQK